MPQDPKNNKENHEEIHKALLKSAKKHHPDIATLIKANGMLALKARDEKDQFNFLARTVTGQQLSTTAANTIWGRLVEYASIKNSTLQKLCVKRNEGTLKECGLSKNKVTSLLGLKKAFDSKAISKQKILQADYEGITDMVTNLWGFGQWSADMTAIFFVCDPDIWPVGDGAIMRGIIKYAGEVESSTDAANYYAPYRSYLALHIWKGLDTEKLAKSKAS